jgi:hypothetical protein
MNAGLMPSRIEPRFKHPLHARSMNSLIYWSKRGSGNRVAKAAVTPASFNSTTPLIVFTVAMRRRHLSKLLVLSSYRAICTIIVFLYQCWLTETKNLFR